MKKIVKEFKDFISRGNVVDLAVGMIMGSACTGIVKSLVNDVFMPIVGIVMGGVDFTTLAIKVPSIFTDGMVSIRIGLFIQEIVNFLIIALCLFFIIKVLNKFSKNKEDEEEVELVNEVTLLQQHLECLNEIKECLQKDKAK